MNIVYVGDMGVRDTAMSIHVRNVAKALRAAGNNVKFLCSSLANNQKGFSYEEGYLYCVNNYKWNVIKKILFKIEDVYGNQLIKLVKKENENFGIDSIIIYGYSGERKLIKYCRKKGIKIFSDMVDWFEPEDYDNFYGKMYCKFYTNFCRKKLHLKLDGIIAISNYLYNYYLKKEQNVFLMPPLFDFSEVNNLCATSRIYDGIIKLVYAGSLNNGKDLIVPLINAIKVINNDKIKITLDLVGVSKQELNEYEVLGNDANSWIFVHGKLSHEETIAKIHDSDFSVLLRQKKLYAIAGYSTKFVESMCLGIPVICTSIGGSDTIIENYVDGIVLKDNEQETIISELIHILSLTYSEINHMKKKAKEKAKMNFDYNNYVYSLNRFINESPNKTSIHL